ncbi:hypothetical protein WN943_014171 [Citrus x changshan-huyou]
MAFEVCTGVSTTMASGVSTLIAMPLDTIKTGLQVLDGDKNGKQGSTVGQTMKNLVKEDRSIPHSKNIVTFDDNANNDDQKALLEKVSNMSSLRALSLIKEYLTMQQYEMFKETCFGHFVYLQDLQFFVKLFKHYYYGTKDNGDIVYDVFMRVNRDFSQMQLQKAFSTA